MQAAYSSIEHLKRVMNNGELPRMTPLPASVLHVIDPDFTIGLGGVMEDENRGMRCPVRGCGVWRHSLTAHLNTAHKNIGGARRIRELLSLPTSFPFESQQRRARRREQVERQKAAGVFELVGGSVEMTVEARRRGRRSAVASVTSVHFRNLRNTCPAQLAHRLIDLHNKIGRTPNTREAAAEYGKQFVNAVLDVYGTWNSAIAQCGLEVVNRHGMTRDDVLETLSAYYAVHRDLPTDDEARDPNRTPIIPHADTIKRILKADSWPKAMQIAASLLNIYGGRYGLPKKKQGAA